MKKMGITLLAAAAACTFAVAPASAAPGGANNDCGSYCANVIPDDSQNGGVNNGLHTGRPQAGTVGKADDKNPPGQYKDGDDANNGYECDGNQGIAKTNPAHTGCEGTSTSS